MSVVYLKPSYESNRDPIIGAPISPHPPTRSQIEAVMSLALLRERMRLETR